MSRVQAALVVILCALVGSPGAAPATPSSDDPGNTGAADAQWAEYLTNAPKTILELQPYRRTEVRVVEISGEPATVTLIDLNPHSNAWFLLTIRVPRTGNTQRFHLENSRPQAQTLALRQDYLDGITLAEGSTVTRCALWGVGGLTALHDAQRLDLPYGPLCDGRLFLRNAVAGSYSHLERVTDFLRDHVWGGDRIVGFVRKQFYRDAFMERGTEGGTALTAGDTADAPNEPPPPRLSPAFAAAPVGPEQLAIEVDGGAGGLVIGKWYPVHHAPGIFVSVIQPRAMETSSMVGQKLTVHPLDPLEAAAIDYLVAMDLTRLDLGFALGTDHPRVGWSERALQAVRDVALPGPDGIDSTAPLVTNGIVNPTVVAQVAATFAGGFKREHGAFRFGSLSLLNHGSHYGFIEQGVVFSKLQPSLATLMVKNDGTVLMKTWEAADSPLLPQLRYARQNGVPLVEYDPTTDRSAPGALVDNWGAGNWSGSEEERLRTVRAGACLLMSGNRHYLIFGYFSTATPSAMARVFQGYGCRYAMHLDMNALEHTYFALYTQEAGHIVVQHLIDGMAEVDRKGGDELAPRFLSFPDDRDFFFLVRKKAPQ